MSSSKDSDVNVLGLNLGISVFKVTQVITRLMTQEYKLISISNWHCAGSSGYAIRQAGIKLFIFKNNFQLPKNEPNEKYKDLY